eukprot:COSAG03_NODE_346_length_8784_cov_37.126540_4_plen_59_part_00
MRKKKRGDWQKCVTLTPPSVGTQTRGFGSPHARNGRLAAVTRNITVGVRGNDAQRAKA